MKPDQINLPEVVAEVRAVFERYEAALLQNDSGALSDFFWNSDTVLRFGLAEHIQGIAAIRRYRVQAPGVNPGRRLRGTVISCFGRDVASVCTEFTAPDTALLGRQTQSPANHPDNHGQQGCL
jgi:hypothetical protein